jgi:zinc protease
LGAVAMLFGATVQAVEPRPAPEKIQKLSFPKFQEFKSENGMDVLVVEHHEQPVVSIHMIFRAGDALDPKGRESLAGFAIDQLNKGTKTRTAVQLAEWIESVGGSASSFSTPDYAGASITVLGEYLPVAYEYLQDIVLNPTFPEDELELLRKRVKTSLELELSQPEAIARRHLTTLVYGDHPYGKLPTVASVEGITRDDMVAFYQKNLVPNNVMMAVVGDVKYKDVQKSVKKYFGEWQPGTPDNVVYAGAPEPSDTRIFLYHKTGAVQTEIFIGHLGPMPTDPDWPALIVGNRVLGGGSSSRLFDNIRETKGWTYRINSSFDRRSDLGTFIARTPVRTAVTDSALVELMNEIKRIRVEPVTAQELDDAKAYLVGNFPLTIETPDQIAQQIGQYKLLGLTKKDLEEYRSRIDAVTAADVQRVMSEYVHPDRAYIVLVGDAMEIAEKVETVAQVEMFDVAGKPLSLDLMTVQPAAYEYDTSNITKGKTTYALTVQSMAIGELNVNVEKKKAGDGDVIAVSSSIAGMFSMDEAMEFRGRDLSPVSYKAKMQMGPRSMGSEFAFTATGVSGVVQGMESPEPKEVAFDLVGGTILDGTLQYAIVSLPMEVGKSYRFPVVDSQTGTLQNADVEIMETVDVETAAGKFSAFRVKIKRPDVEQFLYFDTKAPHVLVKQEIPSQALNLELTSVGK